MISRKRPRMSRATDNATLIVPKTEYYVNVRLKSHARGPDMAQVCKIYIRGRMTLCKTGGVETERYLQNFDHSFSRLLRQLGPAASSSVTITVLTSPEKET